MDDASTPNRLEVIPMYETLLQLRIHELEQDRLREAAAARLAREAKAARRDIAHVAVNPLARVVRALGALAQPTSASA
jgi:hypothetical protein